MLFFFLRKYPSKVPYAQQLCWGPYFAKDLIKLYYDTGRNVTFNN